MQEIIKYLEKQILKHEIFKNFDIYLLQEKKWKSSKSLHIEDSLQKLLSKKNENYQKITSPSRIIMHLPGEKIAISFHASNRLQEKTINKYRYILEECLLEATSLFHANHDELTGILNRHGLKSEFKKACSEIINENFTSGAADQQIKMGANVTLFSFDIDKFKNVNDFYGHDAGDLILKAFSNRIENISKKISRDYLFKFILGRPGGEEFELICVGDLSSSERKKIGNSILKDIQIPSFPSDEEINKQIKEGGEIVKFEIPQSITASIGIAWSEINPSDKNHEDLYSKLKNQADKALYRAKKDGRNCLRNYYEIRENHGKIIKHFTDSDLIQIDIGSSVGVESMDTYSVHFPPFTGNELAQDEESSLKIIGHFPMIESGKIKVVSVQEEISICAVIERVNNKEFPKGSLLKYIHLGSKPILLNRTSNQNALAENLSLSIDYIDNLIKNNELEVVFRLNGRITKDKEDSREKIINKVLLAVRILFPSESKIFHSLGGGLYVASKKSKFKSDDNIQEKIKKINSSILKDKINLYGSACIPSELPEHVTINAESMLFYCNSALIMPKDENNKIDLFTASTPAAVIHKWRRNHQVENALKDYHQFREYGFDSALLDNQLGLAIMENNAENFFPAAEIAFSRAWLNTEKERPVIQGNLGILQATQGNFTAAYNTFHQIEEYILNARSGYLISYAKSIIEIGSKKENTKNILLQAISSYEHNFNKQYTIWCNEIKEKLKSGEYE